MLATATRHVARRIACSSTVFQPTLRRTLATTRYATSHEWVKLDGDIATVGITDFAAKALGDVVYVDLPEVGASFSKGDPFGSVESVKAASDVYAPVSGEIIESNASLSEDPGNVNNAAETDAWFTKFKVTDKAEFEALMDAAAYKKHTETA
ncbi:glycine cleavage system h protein [Nannochloropsis gaditana CCMP526]|uniref:glycine cleavage system h protein n=1 Tax=Nannochloropsis gaditana (strain CCMP526) TaxID=1093141 RepID=UPI00029F66BD|nr:glycine cleavage system h protein [Nannochloropsis gaditana CCMP526]EKU22358.1 glycine cleavage system h protein [Nannochloropsis gaditana CCMP526]|eukprot:XP_005854003.1 glycine cleavage system h protein [Nannochloropsis gaditana CCMP526]